jgi:hypothetical protein
MCAATFKKTAAAVAVGPCCAPLLPKLELLHNLWHARLSVPPSPPQAKAAVEAAKGDSRKLTAQLQEAAAAQEEAGRQLQELNRQIQVAEVR